MTNTPRRPQTLNIKFHSSRRELKMRVIALFLLCMSSGAAIAQTSECQSIPKANARLACYDKTFPPTTPAKPAASKAPTTPRADPSWSAASSPPGRSSSVFPDTGGFKPGSRSWAPLATRSSGIGIVRGDRPSTFVQAPKISAASRRRFGQFPVRERSSSDDTGARDREGLVPGEEGRFLRA